MRKPGVNGEYLDEARAVWVPWDLSGDDADDPDQEDGLQEVITDDQLRALVAPLFGATAEPPERPRLAHEVIEYVANHRVMSTQKLLTLPEPTWMIQDMLPAAPRTVVHGEGGSRKSFIVMDWMLCASQGLQWHGRDITPGRVLYMAGEGVSGIPRRLRAWAKAHNLQANDLKVDWMAVPINLSLVDDKQIDYWNQFIERFNYKYIVVDTLHTAMVGGEENSSSDIAKVYDAAQRIAGEGRHLIFVHHSPKNKKLTARGSSSIRDSVDNVVHCEKKDDVTTKLTADKIRDADSFHPLALTFNEIELDNDVHSLVIAEVRDDAGTTSSGVVVRLLDVLRAEPLTRSQACCAVGDSSTTQTAWAKLVKDGWIYPEARANPQHGRGHSKMIDVFFVDEDQVPLMYGTALGAQDD